MPDVAAFDVAPLWALPVWKVTPVAIVLLNLGITALVVYASGRYVFWSLGKTERTVEVVRFFRKWSLIAAAGFLTAAAIVFACSRVS